MKTDFSHWFLMLCTALMIMHEGACQQISAKDDITAPAPSPSNSFAVSETELKRTLARARTGDIEAMNRLSLYYEINQANSHRGRYWTERAGDAGDESAREYLLGYYSSKKSAAKRKYGETPAIRWRASNPAQ